MIENNFRISIVLGTLLILVASGCQQSEQTKPVRKDLVDAVFASGNIITENQYLVTSLSEGYLDQSLVDEGDSVTMGQLLFHVQDEEAKVQLQSAEKTYQLTFDNLQPGSPILEKLQKQLRQLKNQLDVDSTNFVRHENLIQSQAVSKVEFDRAKLAYENTSAELSALLNTISETKKNLQLELINAKAGMVTWQKNNSNFSLTSQLNGVVLQCFKENGELVKRGETLAEIGSGDFIAKLYIAEEDIPLIKLGQVVFIELNTKKNKSYEACITKIYPAFDKQEQSFIAEAKFTHSSEYLRSGTQLRANIIVSQKQQALVIPTDYLLPGNIVLLKRNREKVPVATGIKTPEWIEITNGLGENDVLITPSQR